MWNKKKVKMLFNYSNGILFKKVSQSLSWCAKDDWERLKMKYASFFCNLQLHWRNALGDFEEHYIWLLHQLVKIKLIKSDW